jgi:hypothetical protein
LWFSNLPDKVKRGQFSVAERSLLSRKQDRVILDAADEKLIRLRRHNTIRSGTWSLPSLDTSLSDSASIPSSCNTSIYTLDSVHIMSENAQLDNEMTNDMNWFETSEIDLSLCDLQIRPTEPAVPRPPLKRLQSGYRKLGSTTSHSVGAEQRQKRPSSMAKTSAATLGGGNSWKLTSAPVMSTIPGDSLTSSYRTFISTTSSSKPLTRQSQEPQAIVSPHMKQTSVYGIGQSAEHYLDPEARLKLRLYLATPSKFDEALEFGFPSLPSSSHSRTSTSSTVPSSCINKSSRCRLAATESHKPSPHVPLHDSLDSGIASRDFDKEAAWSALSRHSFLYYRGSDCGPPTRSETSSTATLPLDGASHEIHSFGENTENDAYEYGIVEREMTLRMTLTRPDLRADEALPQQHVILHNSLLRRLSVRQSSINDWTGHATTQHTLHLDTPGQEHRPARSDKVRGRGFKRFFSRRQ